MQKNNLPGYFDMATIIKFKRPKKPRPSRKSKSTSITILMAVFIVIGLLGVFYPVFKTLLDANTDKSGMVTGVVSVTDGDTIKLGNIKIRLHGIDAPESRQNCYSASETLYPCGSNSTAYLRRLIGNNSVYCDGHSKDRYGRLIAVCYAGDKNLNAEMVRSGWAVAYTYYSKEYVVHQLLARLKGEGLWQGRFENPYEWRRSH